MVLPEQDVALLHEGDLVQLLDAVGGEVNIHAVGGAPYRPVVALVREVDVGDLVRVLCVGILGGVRSLAQHLVDLDEPRLLLPLAEERRKVEPVVWKVCFERVDPDRKALRPERLLDVLGDVLDDALPVQDRLGGRLEDGDELLGPPVHRGRVGVLRDEGGGEELRGSLGRRGHEREAVGIVPAPGIRWLCRGVGARGLVLGEGGGGRGGGRQDVVDHGHVAVLLPEAPRRLPPVLRAVPAGYDELLGRV
mmetsp:Transcript_5046/g.10637  ORF Transcript_5046/g.10637 Transcript_5046/m.10637 type:complete len:250 (-) Transcript_5046:323-1072(-)